MVKKHPEVCGEPAFPHLEEDRRRTRPSLSALQQVLKTVRTLGLVFSQILVRFWPHLNYLNYGDFIFDRKGILSSVYLDEETLHGWKKLPIPFHNLNEFPTPNPITQFAFSTFSRMSTGEDQGIHVSQFELKYHFLGL
ncbi:hypothetical protein K1719_037168 [Acacia pycnantha]|nr:hypothetical protein K1719_037168 [Acacia pycnantha]